jgi:hypothetical protein
MVPGYTAHHSTGLKHNINPKLVNGCGLRSRVTAMAMW